MIRRRQASAQATSATAQFYAWSCGTRATRLRELALANVTIAGGYLAQLGGEMDAPDPGDTEATDLLERVRALLAKPRG